MALCQTRRLSLRWHNGKDDVGTELWVRSRASLWLVPAAMRAGRFCGCCWAIRLTRTGD